MGRKGGRIGGKRRLETITDRQRSLVAKNAAKARWAKQPKKSKKTKKPSGVTLSRRSWLPQGFEFLSGLPEQTRRKWLILTLQAYFDDSGGKRQGRYMAMSGLFGEAEVFASLSDEWRKSLEGPYPPGRISYFKMDEACQLDGEFKDWSEEHRNQKVWQLAKLINRSDLLEIGARIDLAAFEKIGQRWSHVKAKRGDAVRFHSMDQPYVMLFQYVLITAVTEAVARKAATPIDVIFDEQDLFKTTIMHGYTDLLDLENEHPARRAVIPSHPMFRDDKVFVPLQAADMLAGELRLTAEDYPDNPSFIGKLCPRLSVSHYFKDINETELEDAVLLIQRHSEPPSEPE